VSSRPATGATASADSQFDRLGLELDSDREAQRKAWRARYLNTIEIPRLRLLGCGLLLVGALLHNQFVLPDAAWALWYKTPPVTMAISVILAAYALGSWIVLAALWNRVRGGRLDMFFLVFDLVVWSTSSVTGGTGAGCSLVVLVRVPTRSRSASGAAGLRCSRRRSSAVAIVDGCRASTSGIAELCKVLFL
jgi:hypothetical protein